MTEPPKKKARLIVQEECNDQNSDSQQEKNDNSAGLQMDSNIIKTALFQDFEGNEQEFTEFFMNFIKSVQTVNQIKQVYAQQIIFQNQALCTKFDCCIDFALEVAKLFDAAKMMKRKTSAKPFTEFVVDLFELCQIFQKNSLLGFSTSRPSYGYICKWKRATQQIKALKAFWGKKLDYIPGTDFKFIRKSDLRLTEFRLSAEWCNKVVPRVEMELNLRPGDAINWLLSDNLQSRQCLNQHVKKNGNTLPFHFVVPVVNLQTNNNYDIAMMNEDCNQDDIKVNISKKDRDASNHDVATDDIVEVIHVISDDDDNDARCLRHEKHSKKSADGHEDNHDCEETEVNEDDDIAMDISDDELENNPITGEEQEDEYDVNEVDNTEEYSGGETTESSDQNCSNCLSKRQRIKIKSLKLVIQRLKTKYEKQIAEKNEEIVRLKSQIQLLKQELNKQDECQQ